MSTRTTAKLTYRAATALLIGASFFGCADPTDDADQDVVEVASGEEAVEAPNERPHCVVQASDGKTQAGDSISGAESAPICFQEFRQAMAHATDGRVMLPAGATPDTMTEEQAASVNKAAASSTVLAVHYKDSSFRGASLVVTWSCPCSSGCSAKYDVMPSGWNNTISSTRQFAGCAVNHHDGTYATGSYFICWPAGSGGNSADCSYMPGFNDKTSSVGYY